MFGNMGMGELLVIVVLFLAIMILPLIVVLWIVRSVVDSQRRHDELESRVAALEKKKTV